MDKVPPKARESYRNDLLAALQQGPVYRSDYKHWKSFLDVVARVPVPRGYEITHRKLKRKGKMGITFEDTEYRLCKRL